MSVLPSLITFAQLKKHYGIPRTSAYRFMRNGDFPKPIKISPKSIRLKKSEVDDWIESCPTAIIHNDDLEVGEKS